MAERRKARGGTAFERFASLTKRLVSVPKQEVQEKDRKRPRKSRRSKSSQ